MAEPRKFENKPFSPVVGSLKKELKKERKKSLFSKRKPVESSSQLLETPPDPDDALNDEDLFRREMTGVQPLPAENFISAKKPDPDLYPRDDDAEAMAELADLVAGRARFDFLGSDEYVEGIAEGLDHRLLKKLRQGTYAVQAHLDLHGKTRLEAKDVVEKFILESRQRGRRCILIVTGRGLNSKDQIPVLKESLKIWLARGRIARSVLAFCSARPNDGGMGAVYVLLRK